MSILGGLKNLFTTRGKASTLYKRGMDKAKKRDFAGAIEDYTMLLDAGQAPNDIRAMAQFNRALARTSLGDFDGARKDLDALAQAPEVPASVKAAVREKIDRMRFRKTSG